jgi:hypothetical protein
MHSPKNRQFERPIASRMLSEVRIERRKAILSLNPAQKIQMAFSLSQQACNLLIAGLRSQGFTESEISDAPPGILDRARIVSIADHVLE